MNLFFYIALFIFGTLFGSFASVLIYRIKSGEGGIITGRSHCNSCNKILKAIDLIPIFSWAINKAKCRQCKKKISKIYVLLELTMGFLFTCVGFFLIDLNLLINLDIIEITRLLFYLTIIFVTVIYTFYDILFLEIPESILIFGIGLSTIAIITQGFGINIISSLPTTNLTTTPEIIISSILLITSIIGLYIIMLKGFKEIYDIFILILIGFFIYLYTIIFPNTELNSIPTLNSLFGALAIFLFFFIQILISGGKWMGGGDLRIAILIGLILGTSLSFAGTMITYFVGSIIGILLIIISKQKKGKGQTITIVPFGPFLAIGFSITIFFQSEISNLIVRYFNTL